MKFLQEEAELSHARQLEQESRTSAWEAKQTLRRKLWEAFDGWKIDWDCCNSHANGVTVTLAHGTPYDPVKQIAVRLRQIYAAIGVNDLINNLIRAHDAFLKDLYEGADDRTHSAAIQAMLDMLCRIHRGEDETEIASELLAISPRPMMYWGHEAIHFVMNGGPLYCSCGTLIEPPNLCRKLCCACIGRGRGKTLRDLRFDLCCETYAFSRTEDQPIDQCPEWPRWRIALRREFGIEKTEIELFEFWQRSAEVNHGFDDSNRFLQVTIAEAEEYLPGSANSPISKIVSNSPNSATLESQDSKDGFKSLETEQNSKPEETQTDFPAEILDLPRKQCQLWRAIIECGTLTGNKMRAKKAEVAKRVWGDEEKAESSTIRSLVKDLDDSLCSRNEFLRVATSGDYLEIEKIVH